MRTTGRAIIEGAFDKIGIRGQGQDLAGDDLAHGLRVLNDLCEELRLGTSFAFRQGEVVVPITSGQTSRTIGPGGDVVADRPERIEPGSFTRIGTEDWPLEVVDRARYNAIQQKGVGGSRPCVVYYEAGVPLGRAYFWPPGACDAHLMVGTYVGQFADAETEYDLPTGYKSLLTFTAAERLAPDYEVAVPETVTRTAANLRRTVRRGNLVVPQLDLGGPRGLAESAFLEG